MQTDPYRAAEAAIEHLSQLGHCRIAYLSEGYSPIEKEMAQAYRTACLKLNLPEPADTIWQAENGSGDAIEYALAKGRRRNPQVTALFCNDSAGIHVGKILPVPKEYSVVGFGGIVQGQQSHPALTTVALPNPDATARWACADLIAQIHTVQAGRPPRLPTRALLAPELILRKSTRNLLTKTRTSIRSPWRIPKEIDPLETWRRIYSFLKKQKEEHWRRLDLSGPANHSITRQHGWLGAEPLEFFPAGLRSIHGVPFQVVDEDQNGGRAVVTFRSPQSHSAKKKQLPIRLTLKVQARVKALYFLHGCGFARAVPFAKYLMHYETAAPAQVDLIPLGPSRALARKNLRGLKPNLQDWWPDASMQGNFPHAYPVTVFNPNDPAAYQRTLYSLEWINPRPRDVVAQVEVRVNPEAGPCLALIAVTALLLNRE